MLRLAWYTADSIRRFDLNEKNDSQVPIVMRQARLATSWRQSSIVLSAPHYLAADLRRLSDIPMSASLSVQLLETELLLWLLLDGTVCHQYCAHATRCHGSVENSKHFYLDNHYHSI